LGDTPFGLFQHSTMFAYLGLASHPAQVQSITVNHVTLKSKRSYAPGLQMIVEFVNSARTFKCILSLRVEYIQPHRDGTYTWDAALSRPLTDDELRCLT
jgi:hypothetical protein